MKLFGWLNVSKQDVNDQKNLLRDLEAVSARSKDSQKRLDRIVDIERVRLKNLELRAEVLSRTRSING